MGGPAPSRARQFAAGAQSNDPALAAMRRAVGDQWVMTPGQPSPAGFRGFEAYHDPYPVFEDNPFAPLAVVRPASVTEVIAVVRAANEHSQPLWPVSCGRNNAYGGAAPCYPGSVVLDLGRMNQVLEVDDQLGYAVVEPGVSYADLYAHVRKHAPGWWVDVPDLAWGSVLGNALERGNGYTPAGDHFATQCGMEVILPDGDLVRTGMCALPGSRSGWLFKYGFGPYLDGLFTQSPFGVVTKIGVHLMPAPPGYRPYLIMLPREEDIGPATDIMRRLRMTGAMQNVAAVRSVLLEAAACARRDKWLAGEGPVPQDMYRQIMEDLDIGAWNLYGAQYGPQPLMDLLWQQIKDAFSVIPGARFAFSEDRPPGSVLHRRAERMSGVPGMDDLAILNWAGDHGGHINLSPISPATSEDALRQVQMATARCREHGLDYIGDLIVGVRELHHIVMVIFDTSSPKQRQAALELCLQLIEDAAAAGYSEYRTHLALMGAVAGTFSFNDGALMRLLNRLSGALDPAGIMAPGKSGIVPARLRGQQQTPPSPASLPPPAPHG